VRDALAGFFRRAIAHRVRSYKVPGRSPLESASPGCDGLEMTTLPGHRALRTGRTSQPGQIYLLTTTTANRTPWFLNMKLARATSQLMIEPKTWGDARLLCWVLMPDHWHGMIELGEIDSLSLVMNRFKSITSKHIRQAEQISPIWARGFHDHALRRDEDICATARYIVANPLRAKLVDRTHDYPYWGSIWL
jgi:putative transposase